MFNDDSDDEPETSAVGQLLLNKISLKLHLHSSNIRVQNDEENPPNPQMNELINRVSVPQSRRIFPS